MKTTRFAAWAVVIASALFLATPSYALTINDPGVVGTIWPAPGNGNSTEDQTDWANHLLGLGDLETDTEDADGDGRNEAYVTGINDYNVISPLTGGVHQNVSEGVLIPDLSGYQYVLVKYDGPNAGYVLFNIEGWNGGSGNLPEYPYGIWGRNATQYRVSGWTAWGATTVPDGGATLSLLGLALAGIGLARRFMNA